MSEGRVISCVFMLDWVEPGLEDVEAETEGRGGVESAEEAGDEVEEGPAETK